MVILISVSYLIFDSYRYTNLVICLFFSFVVIVKASDNCVKSSLLRWSVIS